MTVLKIRSVGNSAGVTLPKEVTDRLHVSIGDSLYLTESPDGFRLSACNPDFERQLGIAESLMKRYRNALKTLAK